jgi:hypothetical protein
MSVTPWQKINVPPAGPVCIEERSEIQSEPWRVYAYLKCVTHRLKIEYESSSQLVLKLERSNSIPNHDLVLRWSVAGNQTQMGVFTHRTDSNGFFTLLMQPPLNPADNQVTPREITFILDISRSMAGIPIEMSKKVVTRSQRISICKSSRRIQTGEI